MKFFIKRILNFIRPRPRYIKLPVEEILSNNSVKGIVDQFNDFYYTSGNSGYLNWRGAEMLKNPCDLWSYIEIFQELKPSIGITLVNFKLVNEYDIPYPNTEIKLIQINNKFYSIITDSLGECSILLNQNSSFRIVCKVGKSEYEFDDPLYIKDRDDVFTLDMKLQLELYSQIIELNDLYFQSGKYSIQEISIPELNKISE